MPETPSPSTTLSTLAQDAGATQQQINSLSPAAKDLTYGRLLQVWGTNNGKAALVAYGSAQQSGQVQEKAASLHLSVTDITTIQAIFTPERAQRSIGGARLSEAADVSVSCCCCSPCCCAAAMDPDSATALR